jgi:hypothetical protein
VKLQFQVTILFGLEQEETGFMLLMKVAIEKEL